MHVKIKSICKFKNIKARIRCEIFLSDYFMKLSLMYISLHLIWFHEIHVKHVKRKPKRLREKEFKRSLSPATLLKKRLWRRCLPVNFAKFLRIPFLQNTSGCCFWICCWIIKTTISLIIRIKELSLKKSWFKIKIEMKWKLK